MSIFGRDVLRISTFYQILPSGKRTVHYGLDGLLTSLMYHLNMGNHHFSEINHQFSSSISIEMVISIENHHPYPRIIL
jgi:hypothetical protein